MHNAYGGTLYIGKNDNGDVVGLSDKDRKRLLEAIPNKITDIMGIVADVNLLYENGLQYIEITVDKYPPTSAIMENIFTAPAVQ